jgi:hypothetical protein
MNSIFSDLFAYVLTQNEEFGGNEIDTINLAQYYVNDFVNDYVNILDKNP